jgi:hypothetical protein
MANLHHLVPERITTLLLARLSTSARPPTAAALAQASWRYAPTTLGEPQWRELVAETLRDLHDQQLITAARRLVRGDELARRVGPHTARRWQQWSDRILPALGLGIHAGDSKAHARLTGRDVWSAAIAGRVLHQWTDGPPPSPAAVCDELTWRELGLVGVAKRCPPEVRAHFLRRHVAADPGAPEKLLRLLAAQAVEAPRPELDAILAGLTRRWLTGRELGAAPEPAGRSLVDAVRVAAHEAREGIFGDRKVFISSVWDALRAMPAWSALALDDFKAQLVAAHRSQELVLARADLVAAMDPTLVASSETRTDGATFHFIVREPPR